jgi:hypothetical protein
VTTPAPGHMFTVAPHRMRDGSKTGFMCGPWHCRIVGTGFDDGTGIRITVQEMKVDGNRWKPAMSTTVSIAVLRPLEVDVDLFGNPIGRGQ